MTAWAEPLRSAFTPQHPKYTESIVMCINWTVISVEISIKIYGDLGINPETLQKHSCLQSFHYFKNMNNISHEKSFPFKGLLCCQYLD